LADLDQWVISTDYTTDDDVQNTTGFRCIANNTSTADTEPGVGVDYLDFWEALTTPVANTIKLVVKKKTRLIDKVPNGPGGALDTLVGVRRFTESEA